MCVCVNSFTRAGKLEASSVYDNVLMITAELFVQVHSRLFARCISDPSLVLQRQIPWSTKFKLNLRSDL